MQLLADNEPDANAVPRMVRPIHPLDDLSREWAWQGSAGEGVRVAVIDSGIDAEHPAVGGHVAGYMAIRQDPNSDLLSYDAAPHADVHGHGTACAGLIRSLAPACELYSVRVLGPTLCGRAAAFAAGLRWAIDNDMHVCNLSLGTTRQDFYAMFHELADRAYFQGVLLVTAAHNADVPSFPSVYSSVISVASYGAGKPEQFYYNPQPPAEFAAAGAGVRVAWRKGQWRDVNGNSFAAAHMTGLVARILGKHAGLTMFQMKTVLRAIAINVNSGERSIS